LALDINDAYQQKVRRLSCMQVNKRNEASTLGGRVPRQLFKEGAPQPYDLTLASIFFLPTIIPEDLA
jgi:hypothetical protein